MIFNSILRTRKVKQFKFTPRYYDEDKERLQSRKAEIEAEMKGSVPVGSRVRSGFRNRWHKGKNTSNFEKKSNIRLVFIVIILFALSYWVLYT